MSARFTVLVIDCRDPVRVAEFWAAVLNYEIIDRGPNNEFCLLRRRVEAVPG